MLNITSIDEAISSLPAKPTLIVGLGASAAQMAKELGSLLGAPCAISVVAPIRLPGSLKTIGVVSGIDDMEFVDELAVKGLRLRLDELQAIAQAARLEALKEVRELASTGIKPIPSTLENEIILCVTGSTNEVPCDYQLALLQSRRPKSVAVISPQTER